MIEINLLPEEMRKKRGLSFRLDIETMGKVKFLAGGLVLGALIFLIVILSIGSSLRKKQVMRLMLEEQNISAQRSDVEALNKELAVLKTKMGVLGQLTSRGFLWAQKLNELSDMTLPGIWFTRIHTDSGQRFIIEGSVISKKEKAMAAVGKFMKNIRENKRFFKDFRDIKLENVQRKTIDKRDVVGFRIALYFKKDNGT